MKPLRRILLSLSVLSIVVVATQSSFADDRPNFIFFITDDVSHDDLGCYGGKVVKTPNIDRMADEGMRFDNAWLTISSCSPSRCSIVTGRYPHNTGAAELHTSLPESQHMFPEALQAAGYYTVLSGKNHMGGVTKRAFTKISGGSGPGREGDWVQILKDRPKDKPFFCWFASTDAHRDWGFNDQASRYEPADADVPSFLVDGPVTREDLCGYYHEVERTDYFVGELRKELAAQGIADNTYIIYMADNGRPFPRCKTRLYSSGSQTPLVIAGPTVKTGTATGSLVSAIDISATVLDLAGVEKDEAVQGVSFAPVLKDPAAKVRDFAFGEHNWHVFQAHERSVRYGKWLYIRNAFPEKQNMCVESGPVFPSGVELWDAHEAGTLTDAQQDIFRIPRPAEELYDTSADPDQLNNLLEADGPTPSIVDKLRGTLDLWTEQTGDTVPENITNDREDPYRKRNPKHRRGTMPGTERGATEINHAGPVLEEK